VVGIRKPENASPKTWFSLASSFLVVGLFVFFVAIYVYACIQRYRQKRKNGSVEAIVWTAFTLALRMRGLLTLEQLTNWLRAPEENIEFYEGLCFKTTKKYFDSHWGTSASMELSLRA